MLSDRVKEITISQTMMISGEALKLKSEGVDLIDLSVGEPDFHTPNNIKEVGKNAIDENRTKYTLNQGTKELRTAIAAKLKIDNKLEYSINEIVVSNGAKQSIYNSIFAVVNPGDEVIIAAPHWVSYPSMVQLAGGKNVIIETDESTGFKITPKQLASAVTAKTKLLIICNPSNPTGSVYSKIELEQLAEIVKQNNFYVLADEIYEKLIYDDFKFTSFASLGDDIKKKTILINGISKSYAMSGWRIGYAAAPENVASAINKIQSHTTSNASSISQHAAIEAIAGPQYVVDEMLSEFKKRRDYLFKEITSIKGITCYKPEGAFYLFPNITHFLNGKSKIFKITNSFDLAMHLLYEAHIAVIPGSGFGKEGYLRLSYSTSMEYLKEAVYRLKAALDKIH
ncbi:MAG: pyridoxal phosphate-dependent aminotransferase [Ignavibacteriaceae bacterium]